MKRLIAATLACLALAACSAIPTSGPVEKGVSEVATPNDFSPILTGPTKGATPTAIVQGFLTAASGGSVSGFDVAREYLTPAASSGWDPLATGHDLRLPRGLPRVRPGEARRHVQGSRCRDG